MLWDYHFHANPFGGLRRVVQPEATKLTTVHFHVQISCTICVSVRIGIGPNL